MSVKKINFKLFYKDYDINLIRIAIEQLNSPAVLATYEKPAFFHMNSNDRLIVVIKNFEDNYMTNLIEDVENDYKENVIIVTESTKTILYSTIARFGYNNIFVMPHELQKLKSFLKSIVDNTAYPKNQNTEFNGNIFDFERVIGASDKFLRTMFLAKKMSERHNVDVLITGETGTGKGLLARTIHNNSNRAAAPFVDIMCTAIPNSLLESELFGYERGAFTDAKEKKYGLFELAENGTIFLDEIGDLSLELQAKLLRAIDNKMIRRLGGTEDIKIKARIIAATNQNLKGLVEQNRFRLDLFHRLNVFNIHIPPLRDRGNDVISLTEYFVQEMCYKFEKKIDFIDKEILEFISNYKWPGNIRELKNSIERAVLLADNNSLKLTDLFNDFENKIKNKIKNQIDEVALKVEFKYINLSALDRIYAIEVLGRLSGNKTKTAKLLGISRPKLDKLLK